MTARRSAVVGAGLAGLAAARGLQAGGFEVTLFDKGRAAGGRAATRRSEPWRFDHGAQFFTVRDARFLPLVEQLQADGDVAVWSGPFHTVQQGALGPDPRPGAVRYVGTPGMSALPRALAEGLDVRAGQRVDALVRLDDGWRLDVIASETGERNKHGGFDDVVLALPPAQARDLLPADVLGGPVASAVASLERSLQPCLCAMVAFREPVPSATGGRFVVGDEVLAWAAHDGGKPGRDASPTYVLHGTPGWSAANYAREPRAAAEQLVAAFARALSIKLPPVVHLVGHHWGLALADGNALQPPCAFDRARGLALAGDALAGGRVEGAFVSGFTLAETMLGSA